MSRSTNPIRTIDAANTPRVHCGLPQARIHDDVYADLMREAALRERSITWTLNRLLKEALERCGKSGKTEPNNDRQHMTDHERRYERIDD